MYSDRTVVPLLEIEVDEANGEVKF